MATENTETTDSLTTTGNCVPPFPARSIAYRQDEGQGGEQQSRGMGGVSVFSVDSVAISIL